MTDQELIEEYMRGWHESCQAQDAYLMATSVGILPYTIGWNDFIIGDDQPSLDYRSDEELIKMLRDAIERFNS